MTVRDASVLCLIATRGVIHSRTMEARDENLLCVENAETLWEHELPIPEAQNSLVRRGLELGAYPWFWFLEEDMRPPAEALVTMLNEARDNNVEVVAARYKCHAGPWAYDIDPKTRKLRYAGMGCLLVKSSIFDRLEQPYFSTDKYISWYDDEIEYRPAHDDPHIGRQDVYFFSQLWSCRIPAFLSSVECGHLEIIEIGKPRVNDGFHKIRVI